MTPEKNPTTELHVRCCIAGGGPAGIMLGFLLARAGVDDVVLGRHGDFLIFFCDETIPLADFSHLSTKCKFIAFMPQWDFLNFIVEHARAYPTFRLLMQAEVTDLMEDAGRITGVKVVTTEGPLKVWADLVVGADGRHSIVRERARLEVQELGAPIDVLWFRISRQPHDPSLALGRFVGGKIMVMLNRDDYWQCGFVISKGGFDTFKQRGLDLFHDDIVSVAPFLKDRVNQLRDWNEIRLLTVVVDRLRQWYRAGLLCIGDSAHAMSPVGGVGINLAIQDAVAAANILAGALTQNKVTTNDLAKVQKRRLLPTRLTQGVQVFIQNRVLGPVLGTNQQISVPWFLRLFRHWPFLRRIPGRIVGIGFRPEHIETKDAYRSSRSPG